MAVVNYEGPSRYALAAFAYKHRKDIHSGAKNLYSSLKGAFSGLRKKKVKGLKSLRGNSTVVEGTPVNMDPIQSVPFLNFSPAVCSNDLVCSMKLPSFGNKVPKYYKAPYNSFASVSDCTQILSDTRRTGVVHGRFAYVEQTLLNCAASWTDVSPKVTQLGLPDPWTIYGLGNGNTSLLMNSVLGNLTNANTLQYASPSISNAQGTKYGLMSYKCQHVIMNPTLYSQTLECVILYPKQFQSPGGVISYSADALAGIQEERSSTFNNTYNANGWSNYSDIGTAFANNVNPLQEFAFGVNSSAYLKKRWGISDRKCFQIAPGQTLNLTMCGGFSEICFDIVSNQQYLKGVSFNILWRYRGQMSHDVNAGVSTWNYMPGDLVFNMRETFVVKANGKIRDKKFHEALAPTYNDAVGTVSDVFNEATGGTTVVETAGVHTIF